MKRVFLAVGLVLTMSFPASAMDAVVESGSLVDLKLLQTVSSSANSQGEIINFELAEDLKDEAGQVIIRRGAKARGVISYLSHRGDLGVPGKIAITFKSLKSPDGSKIPLTGTILKQGKEKNIFWWIFWLGTMAMSVKGSDVDIPAGTLFSASVEETTTLNLKTASQPKIEAKDEPETTAPSQESVPQYLEKYVK